MKQQQLTIRMDAQIYQMAKHKCKEKFGIGLSPLIKMFLHAFVTQAGVGFYVGDQDLCKLFDRWLKKKQFEKSQGSRYNMFGPQMKDIFDLNILK